MAEILPIKDCSAAQSIWSLELIHVVDRNKQNYRYLKYNLWPSPIKCCIFVGVERESDSEDSDSNSGSVTADETTSRYKIISFHLSQRKVK